MNSVVPLRQPQSITAPAIERAQIPLELIDIAADRLRRVDNDWVQVIAASFGEIGQLQPIRVVREASGRYTLDAAGFGAHRTMAARLAGWQALQAEVIDRTALADVQRARLPEIFENVIRHDLSALSRAVVLAEWKTIHETLNPETRNGGDRRSSRAKEGAAGQKAKIAFWSEATEKTGLSRRAVETAAAIAKGLGEPVRQRLYGTWLENHQASLKQLSDQLPEVQVQVLDLILSTPPEATGVSEALAMLSGQVAPSPGEKLWLSTLGNWTRFTASQREAFFDTQEAAVKAHAAKRGWL